MKLIDSVSINKRFSRSANIERDSGVRAIDGYVPTGRATDVVRRISRGLADPAAGRSFSITGPHGGGKSSLAVFLDALFSARGAADFQAAIGILESVDPAVASESELGLKSIDSKGQGAVRAFATAERESVAKTVARALHAGAVKALGARQRVVPASFAATSEHVPSAREIMTILRDLCTKRPVVLVIDEFGKNLESYAESGGDGDPYLLQELAEAAQGENALPLVLVTMQHLSFDEYVQEASTARRREWAKVQGRFQDIPYIETTGQARRLIAASIHRKSGPLDKAIAQWFEERGEQFTASGLRDLVDEAPACYPLHPLALAVLPSLCSRYGQNERTLFSFLAGAEPLAVPEFLDRNWSPKMPLEFVGLDRVYDYFLESASTSVGTSATASRWLEIEGRIRDTVGISGTQLTALKTIGVLNLVSSGGSLRASKPLLELALGKDAGSVLTSLEERGLVTYRDFADEYRIWQGSDYDLRGAVEIARRTCQQQPLANLLNEAARPAPLVAGRVSQESGVLRVFDQRFSDLNESDLEPVGAESQWDGVVLLATAPLRAHVSLSKRDKPIVVVTPESLDKVKDAAVEAAALRLALDSAEAAHADWVATRELSERASAAKQRLESLVADSWGPRTASWMLLNQRLELDARAGVSAALSAAIDAVYVATPRIANEMISRRELTSQGAKARRMLIDSFISNEGIEAFGVSGYGPERAIYEAVFRTTGLHRQDRKSDAWTISDPSDRTWKKLWRQLKSSIASTTSDRVSLLDIANEMKQPPFGLKDGIIPLLLVVSLSELMDDVALYEHGSLVLKLDDAVAERMARNLGHFSIKNAGASSGGRRVVIEELSNRLGIKLNGEAPPFLRVARALYREVQLQPSFTQQTRAFLSPEAQAVRNAFRLASEPDTLVFRELPILLGCDPFPVKAPVSQRRAREFAEKLATALIAIRSAYPRLLEAVTADLSSATGVVGDLAELNKVLCAQATALGGRVLEPRLSALVGALSREHLEPRPWLENVAMVVAEGHAPRVWTDDTAARFQLQIADFGGAFKRTQALLYGRLAEGEEGYFSRRVTVTAPDGQEITEVVSLTDSERAAVGDSLTAALADLEVLFGSRDRACRTALAWFAMSDEDVVDVSSRPIEHPRPTILEA